MAQPLATAIKLKRQFARFGDSLAVAVILSLALHAGVVALFFIHSQRPPERTVVTPPSIRASLVELSPKAAPAAPAVKSQRRTPPPAARPAVSAQVVPATVKAAPQRDDDRSAERRQLLAAAAANGAATPLQTVEGGDEQAASYIAAIAALLAEQWSRPPSARLGMSATVRIITVPTGRVVGISVIDSSGSEPFDRSVQLAIERVGQFDIIAELYRRDPALYERQFRQLEILFTPEDLRL